MFEPGCIEDWNALLTEDARRIWNQEPKEIRRIAVLFYIIKQEFIKIENNFQVDYNKVKDIVLSNEALPANEIRPLEESPKINKRRPLKHLASSPSLLHIPIEKGDNLDIKNKQEVDLLVLSSSSEPEDDFISGVKPKVLFKQERVYDKSNDEDFLVDCSVIVDEIPVLSENTIKRKKDISKWIVKNNKKPKQYTITKMFIKGASKGKADKSIKSFDTDKTFCTFIENKNNVPVPKVVDLFKDYDVIPGSKNNSPQHVHKTEVVRKKAERLKLPGWSCTDCEKFYKSLNLSPTKLKEKMDACSKHRNKFPPLCETPQGFWDVTMPLSQDDPLQ